MIIRGLYLSEDITHHLFALSGKGFFHIQSPDCIHHTALDVADAFPPPCILHGGPIESLTTHTCCIILFTTTTLHIHTALGHSTQHTFL